MKRLTLLFAALALAGCFDDSGQSAPMNLDPFDAGAGPAEDAHAASPEQDIPDPDAALALDDEDGAVDPAPDPEAPAEDEAPCRIEIMRVDRFGDGVFDRVTTYGYDAADRLTIEETVDPDGDLVAYTRYRYTVDGLLSQSEEVSLAQDGRGAQSGRTVRTTHTYDRRRRLVRTDVDRASGTRVPTLAQRMTYEYAPAGHLATAMRDRGGDGAINETVQYGPDGRVRLWELDGNGDGQVDVRHTITYDEGGNELERIQEHPGGTFHRVWTYDGDTPIQHTEDALDAEGQITARIRRSFDVAGNLVLTEQDLGHDGTPEYREIFTYDGEERRLSWTRHRVGDGVMDGVEYRYDQDGRLVSQEKRDGDGIVQSLKHWTYGPAGAPAAASSAPSSSEISWAPNTGMEKYAAPSPGRWLVYDNALGPDGSIKRERVTRTYDALGNLVEFIRDDAHNGVGIDYRVSHTYTCHESPGCLPDGCVAEEGCEATCSEWGQCVQDCHEALPPTPEACRDLVADVVEGSPCRACGGVWTAAGPECEGRFECVGGNARNACGGCQEMPVHPGGDYSYVHRPGERCGNDYHFHCRDRDFLSCSDEGERGNRCLYDDALPYQAGQRCDGDGTLCIYACELDETGDDLVCVCD